MASCLNCKPLVEDSMMAILQLQQLFLITKPSMCLAKVLKLSLMVKLIKDVLCPDLAKSRRRLLQNHAYVGNI